MELTLKHFLKREISAKALKPVEKSHDLEVLLEMSVVAGLQLDASEASCILAMAKAHGSPNYVFRYGLKEDQKTYTSAHLHLALPATAHLIDRVSGNTGVLR